MTVNNHQGDHQIAVGKASGHGRVAFFGSHTHSIASRVDPQGLRHGASKGTRGVGN